jgi:hypothetical protein
LVAIRKNSKVPKGSVLKRGDLFDIVLIQVKGGPHRDRPKTTVSGFEK